MTLRRRTSSFAAECAAESQLGDLVLGSELCDDSQPASIASSMGSVAARGSTPVDDLQCSSSRQTPLPDGGQQIGYEKFPSNIPISAAERCRLQREGSLPESQGNADESGTPCRTETPGYKMFPSNIPISAAERCRLQQEGSLPESQGNADESGTPCRTETPGYKMFPSNIPISAAERCRLQQGGSLPESQGNADESGIPCGTALRQDTDLSHQVSLLLCAEPEPGQSPEETTSECPSRSNYEMVPRNTPISAAERCRLQRGGSLPESQGNTDESLRPRSQSASQRAESNASGSYRRYGHSSERCYSAGSKASSGHVPILHNSLKDSGVSTSCGASDNSLVVKASPECERPFRSVDEGLELEHMASEAEDPSKEATEVLRMHYPSRPISIPTSASKVFKGVQNPSAATASRVSSEEVFAASSSADGAAVTSPPPALPVKPRPFGPTPGQALQKSGYATLGPDDLKVDRSTKPSHATVVDPAAPSIDRASKPKGPLHAPRTSSQQPDFIPLQAPPMVMPGGVVLLDPYGGDPRMCHDSDTIRGLEMAAARQSQSSLGSSASASSIHRDNYAYPPRPIAARFGSGDYQYTVPRPARSGNTGVQRVSNEPMMSTLQNRTSRDSVSPDMALGGGGHILVPVLQLHPGGQVSAHPQPTATHGRSSTGSTASGLSRQSSQYTYEAAMPFHVGRYSVGSQSSMHSRHSSSSGVYLHRQGSEINDGGDYVHENVQQRRQSAQSTPGRHVEGSEEEYEMMSPLS